MYFKGKKNTNIDSEFNQNNGFDFNKLRIFQLNGMLVLINMVNLLLVKTIW